MRVEEFFEENKSNSDKLKVYHQRGYLFHGSPTSDISELVPRKANDTDVSNVFNNDTAIFAADDPVGPIAFAVFNITDIPEDLRDNSWSLGWYNNKPIAGFPISWKEYLTDQQGTIYVLPKKTFIKSENGNQWKSREPVIPTDTITVRWKDFFELGGEIHWKE